MSKRISLLWIILIVQLLLAVWLAWPSGTQAEKTPLLSFKTTAVTQIDVIKPTKGRSQKLVLKKGNGGWLLPQAKDFPVDEQRVNNLLQQLKNLTGGLPVAVTQEAAKRFNVAPDDYVKKLVLHKKGNTLTLYVGKSAGAGRVYVRAGKGQDIYSSSLSAWLLSAQVDAWRDKQLLQITAGNIKQAAFPQITLQKQGAQWKAAKATDVTLKLNSVNTLLGRLAAMRYRSVVGQTQQVSLPVAAFEVKVETDSRSLTYAFSEVGNQSKEGLDKGWYLTRSDLPYVFKVSLDLVKDLKAPSLTTLKLTPEPKEKEKPKEKAETALKSVNPPKTVTAQ